MKKEIMIYNYITFTSINDVDNVVSMNADDIYPYLFGFGHQLYQV